MSRDPAYQTQGHTPGNTPGHTLVHAPGQSAEDNRPSFFVGLVRFVTPFASQDWLGRSSYKLKEYKVALEFFQAAIEECISSRESVNPSYYNNKGCALYQLGRYDEALESYEEVIKWSEDVRSKIQNPEEVDRSKIQNPEEVESGIRLFNSFKGEALYSLLDTNPSAYSLQTEPTKWASMAYHNKAIALEAKYSKSGALYSTDQYNEVLEIYNTAITENPGDAYIWADKAWFCFKSRKLAHANQAIDPAIKLVDVGSYNALVHGKAQDIKFAMDKKILEEFTQVWMETNLEIEKATPDHLAQVETGEVHTLNGEDNLGASSTES